MALLQITDASGRTWQAPLSQRDVCTIGRAPDNTVVLDDPRASRHHAHVKFREGSYYIIDGNTAGKLSANHVFVNGQQSIEHALREGDRVQIGASQIRLDISDEQRRSTPETRFEDKPLGHNRVLLSADDVIRALSSRPPSTPALDSSSSSAIAPADSELEELRRKARMLAGLYEI